MSGDMFQDLQQFQEYMNKMQELMSEVREQMPQSAEGEDAQGAVKVRLMAGGIPDSITVASDWQRRQPPESLGAAVVEAYGSALSEWMERWSGGLAQSNWEARAQEIEGSLDRPAPAEAASAHPEAFERDVRHVVSRPIEEVAEDVLTAFDVVERQGPEAYAQPEVSGDSAARRVVITLGPQGVTSCAVEPEWAARQSVVRLNQAFAEALADARAKLSSAETSGPDAVADLNLGGLLDEAMAIMKNPRHFM
ncbi:YbaB/EbfC family nucleoid-associated protein [Streptomyces sp. A1277]|uniref:YbaB/EbfC family nucleoid-associated protein n=1 Tax=Streptomyces sp. A1277 TaxID=2563103 RepID=UPI0014471EF5|nr:YbaB/EbfC family nucleoid-associated protein [Streptomyces sp. A1277]